MPAGVLLALAILSEVIGTLSLRASDGFTRPVPSLIAVAGYGVAFFLLSLTLRELEVGIVYAIWAGTGTALVALVGILALGETVTPLKVASLVLIVVGVVGLNLGGAHE